MASYIFEREYRDALEGKAKLMAKIAEANIDYSLKTSADYSWSGMTPYQVRSNLATYTANIMYDVAKYDRIINAYILQEQMKKQR